MLTGLDVSFCRWTLGQLKHDVQVVLTKMPFETAPERSACALLTKPATVACLFGHIILILLPLAAKAPALEPLAGRTAEAIIVTVIDEGFFGKNAFLATGTPMRFFKRFKVASDTLIKASQVVCNASVLAVANTDLRFVSYVLMMAP